MSWEDSDFREFTRLLKGYGYNGYNLAPILDCTPPTARMKLNEPERFTLADIKALNTKGEIPIDEIRQAITIKGHKKK